MNWNEGYTAQYFLTIVDPATWRDVDTIDITGGTVTKTTDGKMESADINMTQNIGEKVVRVYLNARQAGDGDRTAIFTGLLQTPGTDWDGVRESHKAACYSVLQPAADILLPRGWYAGKGANAAAVVADLLDVLAPVKVSGDSPKLTQNIVAESKETCLTMAWKILNAIGWRLRISGDGTITICPLPTEAVVRLDPNMQDIVELKVTDEQDLYSCPNVFRAISGDSSYTARDEDAIEARGREIWAQDENVTLNDGESLKEYAKRRLKELQAVSRKVKYSRRFLSDVVAGDMVDLNFPGQNVSGSFIIKRQQITLGYSGTVSEEVER